MMTHLTKRRIDWNAVKDKLCAAQTALEQSLVVDDLRKQQVFHERAKRLAAHQTNYQSTADSIAVLVFKSGEETYGVELRYVAQVLPDARMTPIPGSPETLLGVANLQGDVRSVLGLQRLLGLSDRDDKTKHYILLLRHDDRQVGLRVGQIEGVRRIVYQAATSAGDFADSLGRYVRGLTRDNLIVLHTEVIFEHLSFPEL